MHARFCEGSAQTCHSNAVRRRFPTLPDEAALQQYAGELYLSGLVLLDPDGNVITHYDNGTPSPEKIEDELHKSALLEVAQYPEKNYSARLDCDDGSYVDLSAYGRLDVPGVVVAYYHTPLDYIASYSLSFQTLLSGYSMENDGIIAVTKGDYVVASNDEAMVGCSVEEIDALRNIRDRAVSGKMVHVSSGHSIRSQVFGIIDRGRDYYVYVYQTERSVFESTPRKMLLAVVMYFFALMLVEALGWKAARRYEEEQRRQEQEYQVKLMEAAHKAESANIAKTEFLQRMSHDIRTPINGIRGMVEISEHFKDDPEKQNECRRKIWDASGLLLELVNEVLDMGKLESGEVVLEERPFNLIKLMDEVCETLRRTAEARGITIDAGDWRLAHQNLIGSPLHLKRMVMNILSNAVKYNKDNGSIVLRCRETQCDGETAWIEFSCADTGIGMSEEYQKHLYEPFTQEENGACSTYGGTGLGMAITKSLVDKMGGTITCRSEKDVGTTFRILLPLRIDHDAQEQPQEMQRDIISLKGIRVLLAEDNELNMEIARFQLENAGAEVTEARNGREAVDLFRNSEKGAFDVILMDIMMPEMDGYQATRIIRAMERPDAATIPIIAMTANAFADDRQKAKDAGMNEHITKPLEPGSLLKTIRQYFHS